MAGVTFLVAAAAAAGFAASRLCARWLPHLGGTARILALALLSASALALSILLPGAAGVLSRGTWVATALALAALSALATRRRGLQTPPSRPTPSLHTALAAVASLAVGAWLVGELIEVMSKPPLATDFISYDLPVIGRWIQSGSVWPITELFPLQTHGTYPQTADLVLAAFVLPFHNDALVGAVPFLALALTGLAAYGCSRAVGTTRSAAALLASTLCAVPILAAETQAAPPDALALAAFTTGLLFLLRHLQTHEPAELVLAGLGLGFAAGSLWYFTSAVALIALVWIVLALAPGGLAESASWRQGISRAGWLGGTIIVVSGFWFVRNLVETGDPVYPVKVALAGHTIFSAPPDIYREVSGFSISNYLNSPHVLGHYILPALRKAAGLPGMVLLVGLGLLAGSSVRAMLRRHLPKLSLVLILACTLLTVLYVLTPYSAFGPRGKPVLTWVNVRYLLPALTLAVPASALATMSAPRWLRLAFEVAACAATLQGLYAAHVLAGTPGADLGIGFVVTAVAGAGLLLWAIRARHSIRGLRPGAALLAGSLVALAIVGYVVQRHVNRARYSAADPTFAWIQAHPAPMNIGLAGSFNFNGVSPAWPTFGERIQNRVTFVGPLRGGHLTQYSTRHQWLTAVRRGGYKVLEIAVDSPPAGTSDHEPRWAAESGFSVIAHSARLELVRVSSTASGG